VTVEVVKPGTPTPRTCDNIFCAQLDNKRRIGGVAGEEIDGLPAWEIGYFEFRSRKAMLLRLVH
jgi:hypothetical protein